MSEEIDFQSREEWQNAPLSCDECMDVRIGLDEVATVEEVEAAIAEARQRWKELGREMVAVERGSDQYRRAQWKRQDINKQIKALHAGRWPLEPVTEGLPTFATLYARMPKKQEEKIAAIEREQRERRSTDEAWQKELEEREYLRRYLTDGPVSIHIRVGKG